MSAVAIASMTEQEAQKLTERIRITAVTFTESRTKLMDLVQEAKAGKAHLALGYASWTAYLAEVLGEEPMRLARGERQEMVQMLSAEGMSTRAIAPIVGAGHVTVSRDLASVPNETDQPRTVESMDGITRTFQSKPEPAEPAQPKRRPVTDAAQDAAWELLRAAEKLQRIFADDRFAKHQSTISTHIKGNLNNSLAILNTLADTL